MVAGHPAMSGSADVHFVRALLTNPRPVMIIVEGNAEPARNLEATPDSIAPRREFPVQEGCSIDGQHRQRNALAPVRSLDP